MAELAATEKTPEAANVAAGNAVLAGIAAADAACCRALGESSRGMDHRDAVDFLHGVAPGGPAAAKELERLLALKDRAHYGFANLSAADLTRALRRATNVMDFAARVLER